jgi:hypothetical protein
MNLWCNLSNGVLESIQIDLKKKEQLVVD